MATTRPLWPGLEGFAFQEQRANQAHLLLEELHCSGKGDSFFQRGYVTVEVSTGEKKTKNGSKIAGQAVMVNKTETGQATSLKKHQTD